MDASFRTVISRFGLSRGNLLERPRNIVIVEDSSGSGARRHRGTLFMLIETLGGLPDPEYVWQRLAEIIQSEFYEASGSVTGAISAALRAANDWLFEENLNSPREQRGVAGVSVAALRDGELFLGQIGPSLAYLSQPDGLRRFPEESPWLRQAIPPDAERAAVPPLGVRRVVEPQFYHAVAAAGDVFVLASAGLARLTSGEALARALGQGVPQARQALQGLPGAKDLSVLIVGLEAEGATLPWPKDEEAARVGEVAERPVPRLHRPVEDEEPAPRLRRPTEDEEPAPRPLRGAAHRPAEDLLAGLRAAGRRAGRGLLTLLQGTLPDRTSHPARGFAPRRVAGRPAGSSSSRTLIVLAISIPVIVLAVVGITRWQFESSRRAQVLDLLRQAAEAQEAAVNTGQREAQRQNLRKAIDLIDQALRINPVNAAATQMREKASEQLDAASNVQRLYTIWELATLAPDGTTPSQPGRIIVHDRDVFVLDATAGRVYHRVLNPAGDALEAPPGPPILQKGETHGGTVVGDLVDMVWMPIGGERQRPNLLILDRNGSLFEYDAAQGITALPVADAMAWKKPQASGGYSGNFYLLDPQQRRILKYVAAPGGYTSPPADYLRSAVDISGAIDLAIDGNIYVLQADGTVLKFLQGDQQIFRVADLDEPLRKPVAIFVGGEDDTRGYVYVADAGLARVVQFTKQGEFVRQFKAREGQTQLNELRGLYVDEAGQRMYLASGSGLYAAPLSQQAPTPATAPASSGQ